MPVMLPSFFPDNTILITKPSNLQIYVQEGTHRRKLLDEVKLNKYSDFTSVNLDFVVADYKGVALIENIEIIEEEAP